MSIAHASKDENGKYSGGIAGDQTGNEVTIRSWYNRPWNVVLRHPDKEVRARIAKMAKATAKNDKVGYDQGNRLSFYKELKAVGYKPKKIKNACECDCSALVAAIVIGAGKREGWKELTTISPSLTTSGLRKALEAVGFKVLTKKKYLNSSAYLKKGDILLYEGHHTAINLTKGSKV